MKKSIPVFTTITDLAMTSREIARLTGKRHDHVLRDIRHMLVELHGEGGLPRFQSTYMHEQNGQRYPCFNLPKDLTITLLTGYSVQLRAAVINRWMELEAQAAQVRPQTYLEALEALIKSEQEKEAQATHPPTFAEALRQAADAAQQNDSQHTALTDR